MTQFNPIERSREHVDTLDGWRLAVHRVAPSLGASGPPVMMVHGHGTGAWSFLGGPGDGLAGALARAGRDVFAVELRGSTDTVHRERRPQVRISDKLGIDLVALLEHVRRRTGSEVVDAVGHSMGGILLYLGALSFPEWPIRRLVTVGSPLALAASTIPRPLSSVAARFLAPRLGRLPVGSLATLLGGRVQASWMPVHFHPDHVEEHTFRAFLRWGVTDVFGGELRELLRWVERSDHRELLPQGAQLRSSRLTMPTRFLVGSEDPLTSPEAVRRTFEAIGSAHCELIEVGRKSGFSRDYRHVDILLGESAQREVAPLVVEWLGRGLSVAEVGRVAA